MTEYALGASVSCRDGYCGVVSRTILDPAAGLGIGMGLGSRGFLVSPADNKVTHVLLQEG
jgi:hypothetical protein